MRLLLITLGVILFLPSRSAIRLKGGEQRQDSPSLEIKVQDDEIFDGRALARSCDVCSSGKVKSLKLRYDLPSATSSLQGSQATCVSDNYPKRAVVEIVGGSFTISQGSKISITGAIGGNLEFIFDGWGSCFIDVSCSTPLVVGDKIGPFLVVAGNDCNGGQMPMKTTQAPVQPVAIRTRKPTPAPTSGQTSNIQIHQPTGSPSTNRPCVVPDKVVYECGETITATFDYSQHVPERSARIDDRIGIFPCYIHTFKEAEVWQWECGAPPLDPQSCLGTRSKGTVVFNQLPGYNNGGQLWPLTANYNSQRQEVNRCFKIVILRNNGGHYTRYCESDGFTVNENSEPKCSIRLTSPTDDVVPKPTPASPPSPVQSVQPVVISTREPTPAQTSGQTSGIQIHQPTGSPSTNRPCVVPDKVVYECGETITATFDYSQHIPERSARIDDRIGIFPCYIHTFKEAEVWQWECGAPPLDPQSCLGTRSKGTVVFNQLPGYNNGGQLWPLTANYNSQRQEVNRCFKIVILRNNGGHYTRYCESDGFTVNENSEPKCSIRLTSPTDDVVPKPTPASPPSPVQSVQPVVISTREPTPAQTSGQTSGIQIRQPTGNPSNGQCVVPDKVVYECGEAITVRFDYSQHIPEGSPRIDDQIGIFPCYIHTFKEAEVWQWECGAPPLDPQSCLGTRSKGTVAFNELPGYNNGGQLWPLTANYNSQRQAVNRCFKIVILRNNGGHYTRYCESDGFTVNENSEPKCSIRLTSPTDDVAPKPTPVSPQAPVQSVQPVVISSRKPTPAPTSGQTSNIQIHQPTGSPSTNRPCVVPDKVVYECGETITATFDYSQHIPERSARIDDRIGIFPCYIHTFKEAEVWQWECGAPPLDPQSCLGTRSKGTVVFNQLPGYNNGGQLWPLTANYNSQRQEVNRCFKIVILRNNGGHYTRYCESDGFTVNENSEPKCSIRLTSPTDDVVPKPTPASPPSPVQSVQPVVISTREPTPAQTSGQTSGIQIRQPTGNPSNGQCVVPDKVVYECGEAITVRFDYSQHIPEGSPRIDDRIGIFPCYIHTFKEAEVWQWECGAPPLDPQSCSGTRSKGTVVFNALPGYNDGGQLWPLTANYNSQRQAVNRCFKIVILRNNGGHYTRYCESDGFTVNENSEPKCSIRLTSPTDDVAPKPTPASPQAPVQSVQPVVISSRKPTPAPTSGQTSNIQIHQPTGSPSTNRPCVVPDKVVYECGETITATFDYSQHIPERSARIDDRIGIFPCYIHTFKEAEVWQWECGAPPLDPQSCSGTRSKGTVVFNQLPGYNNGGQLWPLTANYNSQRQEVNRCFKIVILRNNGGHYTRYCESDGFTVNENSEPKCSIRLTSPTDDVVPKPTPASPPSPVQSVQPVVISTREPTPAQTSGQTSGIQIRQPTGNPSNGQCVVPDKVVYECGEAITVRFDYSQHIPEGSPRIDDRIGIFPCYIHTFKEAEVWQWECGAPPLDPQSCSGTRSKGTVVFNALPGYNDGGQLWPLTANYNSQRQEVNRCFKIVILRNDGEPYSQYCESDPITVNDYYKPGCVIRLSSPTDDF